MKISRGLRNNNPLNIRRNGTKWKGLATEQCDKEFFCFSNVHWGYRAAFITLMNYSRRHRLTTLRQWISRWAPPIENDTEAYIRFVSQKSGIPPERVLSISDEVEMQAIVSAMSHMENGVPAIMTDVEKGWELAIS